MRRVRLIAARLGGLVARTGDDRDLAEELAQHMALLEDDLKATGMAPDEARRRARLAVRPSPTMEAVRDARRGPSFERVWQDLRHSVRALRRAPSFTAASLLTLAIGIGATTTVFSIVNMSLLQPLPYPESDRLLTLGDGGANALSGEAMHALRERVHSVSALAWQAGGRNWNLAIDGRATNVIGGRVSAGVFEVLGVRPQRGRTFTEAEDQRNGPPVVVLSDRLWRSTLGARPDVVGATLSLGGQPHEVVGVMPPGFRTLPGDYDLWTPLRLPPTDRGLNQTVLARLREGVALEQARAELATLAPALARDLNWPRLARMTWQDYRTSLGAPYRQVLTILLAAVACVLLIACVNVAGLQLVRATARRNETATRAAIGGGPRRLMLETLTESLVLSVAGATLGVAGAVWVLPRIAASLPPALLDGRTPTLEPVVLAFALVTAIGTGLLFGYLPAREARRVDVRAAMGSAGRQTAAASTLRWRRVLAAGQIALALMLLVGAGLLGRTLLNLYRVDFGFDPQGMVVGRMSLTGTPDPGGLAAADFFERTLERLRESPDLQGAAVTSSIPVDRTLNLALEPPANSRVSEVRAVDWRYVSSGFFELLNVPVVAGRSFGPADTATSPPVAIVNAAFARAYFGREPALGRTLTLAFGDASAMTIVGVVADVRNASGSGWARTGHALKQGPAPGIFVPATQGVPLVGDAGLDAHWIVRSRTAADATAAMVAGVVQAAEPRLPFVGFRSMDEVIHAQVAQEEALFTLLAAFAGVALVLACVGTYGMMAYSVSTRARDVGIRMACGASSSGVLALFVREALVVMAVGASAGALLVANTLRAYVWGLEPFDVATFIGVALAFAVVVLLSVTAPALRAARLQPATVLRQG